MVWVLSPAVAYLLGAVMRLGAGSSALVDARSFAAVVGDGSGNG